MADQRTLFRSCGWKEHFSQHYLRHILDPSQEIEGMHIDSYICVLHNKINHGLWNWDKKTVTQRTMLFGELATIWKRDFVATGRDMDYDAITYECPYLWSVYVSGENDACMGYQKYNNFHWVLCKIVQQQKKICMYDSLSRGKDPKQRIKDIEPLTRFLPAMLRCGGFFDHTNIDPWVDGINLSVVDHRLLPQQLPGVSCGAFVMKFMENIMRSKDHKWNFEGKDEKRIREEIARDIFINSESVD